MSLFKYICDGIEMVAEYGQFMLGIKNHFGAPYSGFYPSTFLQPVNSNRIFKLNLFKSLQVFFVCLSRKTLDRFLIL